MNTVKDEEKNIPLTSWANWALLRAWFERQCQGVPFPEEKRVELGEVIINRFKETVCENDHGPRCYVILTNAGLWGTGKTLEEAVNNAKSYSSKHLVRAVLILNADKGWVDNWGTVHSDAKSTQICLGTIGTVGSILRACKTKE